MRAIPFLIGGALLLAPAAARPDDLAGGFAAPPESARPWVYWFWMDGNISREGITADLEAMKSAGLGGVILMEVDVGVPRGPVAFMSPAWRALFTHAAREAERLGLQVTINAGPGWTGSGGPWVRPEQSMQHLTAGETAVHGPARFDGVPARPAPRPPFFGEGTLTPELKAVWKDFYRDVAVLAVPASAGPSLADFAEKALYFRAPYSSQPGVKPHLPAPAEHPATPPEACIPAGRVVDLTSKLDAQGRLTWDVPEGDWTILRFGRTLTGQTTRPAPVPGLGFECDKFDPAALDAHFDSFVAPLLDGLGPHETPRKAGLTSLHIDSWEMSAQNWSERFPDEFRRRRGYDPVPYLPVMTGRVVAGREVSERFLWDLRQTAQELVVENHALRLKSLARKHGLGLSIEPYDMNPCSDLSLGGAADVPMCEFWTKGHGFSSEFSVIEAVSIAHALGRPVVAAESFTAGDSEAWRMHPGAMKAQGDWALAAGINRIVFHRFAHQPWPDRRPGMTMGPYGVHWDRTQTWWDLVPAYHAYLARCQFLLRQGASVADIAYLAPEGAPNVFRPPPSALAGDPPDRRGYNFAGLAPEWLDGARVEDGRVVLPSGASYRVLVLPETETMTPGRLRTIAALVRAGATVVGPPPRKSPGLGGYPACDDEVRTIAASIWGNIDDGAATESVPGRGRVVWDRGPAPEEAKSAASPVRRLGPARWIWHPEGDPASAAPPGVRRFRRGIVLGEGRPVSADLHVTADNVFRLRINGEPVAEGGDFRRVVETDAAPFLRPGTNRLDVEAENSGDGPNPAGLIALLRVRYADGRVVEVPTDGRWFVARGPGDTGEGDAWVAARDLGPADAAPWRLGDAPAILPSLYPPYERTAALLDRLGLPPDFETDGPVRYAHRRAGDMDLYFVANREDRTVDSSCVFRVADRQPELWDPMSGGVRDLPRFEGRDSRTVVPLRFEPHQSFFVVFRRPAPKSAAPSEARNFAEYGTVAGIEGPWDVTFRPGGGGPAGPVRFERLEDWARRPEAAIRDYSGLATYRARFDLPAGARGAERRGRIRLAVGLVHVMARVRLNGKDLGVVWAAPRAVDITEAARDAGNELEIDVANLWPNRLIADAGLPPEQRVAWTTWNPYRNDTPPLPSGLLGPVTVEAER